MSILGDAGWPRFVWPGEAA